MEYIQDPTLHHEANKDPIVATARKLVVLSAGAFGSPTILERSGVGSPTLLEAVGIQTVVDLPGVGENYQGKYTFSISHNCSTIIIYTDHCGLFPDYYASDDSDTLDAIARGDEGEVQSK